MPVIYSQLFLACLEAIQADNIMTDIDQKKLFSNIRDIYEANLKFWTLYLYPMVRVMKLIGLLNCITYFRQLNPQTTHSKLCVALCFTNKIVVDSIPLL